MDTSGIDVPSSRAIAKQLLTLAQDADNQPFIVQEKGCLAGLIQYTLHDDVDVVLMSLRALEFLASHPSNKETMRDFPDLVSNVSCAMVRQDHPKIIEFAQGTLKNLSICIHTDDKENSASFNTIVEENPFSKTVLKTESNVFRTIVFSVENSDDYKNRETIEKLMIRCPGVISVTVNQHKQQVVVGTRQAGDEIIKSLSCKLDAGGFACKLVIKTGQEELVDDDYPDYIEESDYEDDETHTHGIMRQGFGNLESRLEQQRIEEEERKQEKSSRLIGKMSNVLSNASSWLMGY